MPDAAPAQELHDGRYAVVRVLGQGAQGATLEAVDKQGGRPVAIKRFQIRGAGSWKDVELAEREARVLAQLSHPSLPVYLDHFEEDGCLYLVMERIEGESLAALRARGGGLAPAEVVRLLNEIGEALDYLHGRVPPVIHRDIKPSNVIRRPDGSFCLVDFGSVRASLEPAGGSTVVGTFGYMAPEQFQGRALPATDIYGLGATVLTLLANQEPEALPHRGLAIDVRASLGGSVEPGVIDVLKRMLEPDPDQRATRVEPLLDQLRSGSRARRGPDRESRKPPPPPRVPWGTREEWQHWADRTRHEWEQWADGLSAGSTRRDARHEARGERHARRRHAHEERRAAYRRRREARWRGRHSQRVHPLLMIVLLLGLTAAQLAVWALFTVLLPTFLTLLSLFVGNAPRRAADRSREIGERGVEGLRRASALLRGVADEETRRAATPPHTRVEGARPRVRIDEAPDEVDTEGEELEQEEREPPRAHRH